MAKTLTLPSNVEAERCVLGAMLMDQSAVAIGLGSLNEDTFSGADMRNRYVFRAIKELSEHGMPIDATTVTDELINLKLDQDAGGPEYLFTLVDSSINPNNVNHYVQIVKEQAVLRDMLVAMKEITDDYGANGCTNIGEFVMDANRRIGQIAASRSVGDFQSSKDVANIVAVELNQISGASENGITGVNTGYKRLNLMVHGWQKGDLIILAARPGMGKTALAMNFAFNAASRTDKTVAFFSLEMTNNKIMQRLIANRACVANDKIQTGMLNATDRVKIASAIDEISKTPLYLDDTPDSQIGDIIAKSTKLKAVHPDLSLIVIDYLGRIRSTPESNSKKVVSRTEEVGYITGSLKTLARQLQVPVIVCCQLNRNVEGTDSKVPQLSNLRESGNIEQDADMVLLLYRADYYTSMGQEVGKRGASWTKNKYQNNNNQNFQQKPQQEENDGPKPPEITDKSGNPSVAQVLLAKNRNGQNGGFSLIFSKAYSRFDDPSTQFEESLERYKQATGQSDF